MIALTALLNEVNGHYMTGLAGPVKPVLVGGVGEVGGESRRSQTKCCDENS